MEKQQGKEEHCVLTIVKNPRGIPTTTPLEYESLPNHYFRLLYVNGGSEDDQLTLSMKICRPEETNYTTLSYRWGERDQPNKLIDLNGRPAYITETIHTALLCLRKEHDELAIWVDQLCINQVDTKEKNEQVAMMSVIYKKCSEVYVWLGPGPSASLLDAAGKRTSVEGGFRLMEWLAQGRCFKDFYYPKDKTGTSCLPVDGINYIFAQEWWQRVWVVQEIILPPKKLLVLGSTRGDWEDFADASNYSDSHRSTCCAGFFESLPSEVKDSLLKVWTMLQMILAIEVLCRQPNVPLRALLEMMHDRIAKDSRDKVFAIVGLIDEKQWDDTDPIPPNYDQDPAQLFRTVASKIIDRKKSLHVLAGHVRADNARWYPDWSLPRALRYNFDGTWVQLYSSYNADSSKEANIRFRDDGGLETEGIFVDKICKIGKPCDPNDWTESYEIYQSWKSLIEDHFGASPHDITPCATPNPIGIEIAFIHTLLGNRIVDLTHLDQRTPMPKVHNPILGKSYRPLQPDDLKLWKAFFHRLSAAEPGCCIFGGPTMPIERTVRINTKHRQLFITEKGFIGMGPQTARVGDDVFVLKGGRVPFVLRGDGGDEGKFWLVGDCYVHGVMEGEVVSGNDGGEKKWMWVVLK